MERGGYVYILSNRSNTVVYTGATSELKTRILKHRSGFYQGAFTKRYGCYKLVYFKGFMRIEYALDEEKRIKGLDKIKKRELIRKSNPDWKDLFHDELDD